jgi:hypothetical protein
MLGNTEAGDTVMALVNIIYIVLALSVNLNFTIPLLTRPFYVFGSLDVL